MKIIITLLLAGLIAFTFARESSTKEPTAEEQKEYSAKLLKLVSDVTYKSDIDKLTKDDVPEEWKTTVTQSEDKDLHTKTFKRGNDTILTISWLKKSHTLNLKRKMGVDFERL
jgi:hypothetical protein